jgi:DNA-binding transcriptional LysR family regulator
VLNQFLHRAGDVLDGDVGVDPVLVQQVDGCHTQSLQHCVDNLANVLRPAVDAIARAVRIDQIVGLRERPTGRVRLLVTPLSAVMVLAPKLVPFARRFPDIVLDVTTTQEGRTELVAAGFDAGIHLGESIQRDMVAVRVSRDQRLAVVGSPDYFASHPKPSSPHDVLNHQCINLRGGSAGPYRWESRKTVKPSSLT